MVTHIRQLLYSFDLCERAELSAIKLEQCDLSDQILTIAMERAGPGPASTGPQNMMRDSGYKPDYAIGEKIRLSSTGKTWHAGMRVEKRTKIL